MPREYGYGSRGYGGGYQSNFRYDPSQPAAFQYQSFYDPSRVGDFIQSSQRSAQEYDTAYAGALTAQDELAQTLVGMQDIAAKNQILNASIGDMNKTVEEKFGGDWARAAKDIAAQVTQVRSNPFWNTAKEADRQRKIAEELKIKYGPNAFVFNDPTKIGVMDEQGQLRGAEAFTPDIVEKGDWTKTARELMAGLTPDANPWGLTRDEIDTFVKYGSVEGIPREKIEGFANDPAIQEALLAAHPEIRRGVAELDQTQQERFGLFGKTPEEVAREQLLGASASAQYRQVDMKVAQDNALIARRKAAAEGSANDNYVASSTYGTLRPGENFLDNHMKMMKGNVGDADFKFAETLILSSPETGVNYPYQMELKDLGAMFRDGRLTADEYNQRVKETGRKYQEMATGGSEEMTRAEVKQANREQYYKSLQEQFPQLEGVSMEEGFNKVTDYYTRIKEQRPLYQNMVLSDSEKNLKTMLFSNVLAADFRARGFTDKATGDVFDKNSMVEATGYDNYIEFQQAIAGKDSDVRVDPKIDFSKAEILVTVPTKGNKKGKGIRPVELSFQVDTQTKDILTTGQTILEAYESPKNVVSEEESDARLGGPDVVPLLNYKGKVSVVDEDNAVEGTLAQGVLVTGTGSLDGNNKKIWLINYGENGQILGSRTISSERVQELLGKQVDLRFRNIKGPTGNPGLIE
jgi:hypothetical protein